MEVCLTERTRRVFTLAQEEARRSGSGWIATEHLLLAILLESDGLAARVLQRLGIEITEVRYELQAILASHAPPCKFMQSTHLPQSSHVQRVVEWAHEEAREFHHAHVGTEHLLLGLLRESESIAAQVLGELGVRLEEAREEIVNQLHLQPLPARATPWLDQWGRDRVGALARAEPMASVADVEVVLALLGTHQKCVPVAIGSRLQVRGLWNGLAHRFQSGTVPMEWHGTRLVVLPQMPSDTLTAIHDEVTRVGGVLPIVPYRHSQTWRRIRSHNRLRVNSTTGRYLSWKMRPVLPHEGEVACRLSPLSRLDTLAWLLVSKRKLEIHHRFRIPPTLCEWIIEQPGYDSAPEKALAWLDRAGALRRVRESAYQPSELTRLDQQISLLEQRKEQAVLGQDFERAFQIVEEVDELRHQREHRLADVRAMNGCDNDLTWGDLRDCGEEWLSQK